MKRRSSWVDWLRRRFGNAACILVYHRIIELPSDPWQLCVSPQHFQQQMQALRELCYPVSLSNLPSLLHGRRRQLPVAVTFDDGYADNLHQALPILQQYEIPATFFLVTGSIREQRELWWDELERVLLQPGSLPACLELTVQGESHSWHLGDTVEYSAEQADTHRPWRAWQPPPTPRHAVYCALGTRLYSMAPEPRWIAVDAILRWAGIESVPRPTHRTLTRAEVATLAGHQLVEIGAHTANHRALGHLSAADQQREIDGGKNALQEMLARPVMSFAYPHGDYTEETIDLVRRAGFQRACTTRPRLARRGADPFQLPRNCIGDVGGDATARSLSEWQRSCV
jgi:peptidoglycan/xylan/chitin deacetylase (PgdA/CDA1 family)